MWDTMFSIYVVCLKEEFSCHDGTCISDSLICNGVEDCANGEFP